MSSAEEQIAGAIVAATAASGSPLRWAKITATAFFGGVQIRFVSAPGEAAMPAIGGVPYLLGAYTTQAVGDWVLVAMVDGAPVVLGKSSLSP